MSRLETTVVDFIRESNHIEGLDHIDPKSQLELYMWFLSKKDWNIHHLSGFVASLDPPGELRRLPTQNVRIGNHIPPQGGPKVIAELDVICEKANKNIVSAFDVHKEYETLHPFTDGNGRSGRLIWQWQMNKKHGSIFSFLHMFYYQTLDALRI